MAFRCTRVPTAIAYSPSAQSASGHAVPTPPVSVERRAPPNTVAHSREQKRTPVFLAEPLADVVSPSANLSPYIHSSWASSFRRRGLPMCLRRLTRKLRITKAQQSATGHRVDLDGDNSFRTLNRGALPSSSSAMHRNQTPRPLGYYLLALPRSSPCTAAQTSPRRLQFAEKRPIHAKTDLRSVRAQGAVLLASLPTSYRKRIRNIGINTSIITGIVPAAPGSPYLMRA